MEERFVDKPWIFCHRTQLIQKKFNQLGQDKDWNTHGYYDLNSPTPSMGVLVSLNSEITSRPPTEAKWRHGIPTKRAGKNRLGTTMTWTPQQHVLKFLCCWTLRSRPDLLLNSQIPAWPLDPCVTSNMKRITTQNAHKVCRQCSIGCTMSKRLRCVFWKGSFVELPENPTQVTKNSPQNKSF